MISRIRIVWDIRESMRRKVTVGFLANDMKNFERSYFRIRLYTRFKGTEEFNKKVQVSVIVEEMEKLLNSIPPILGKIVTETLEQYRSKSAEYTTNLIDAPF